jgi:hypothetical protein
MNFQHQSQRIGQDEAFLAHGIAPSWPHTSTSRAWAAYGLFALSTIDAFCTVKTSFACVLTGFHTLGIHDAGTGLRFASFKHTNLFTQGGVQTFPETSFDPASPVTVHGSPGWEVDGHGSPFNAVVEHVKYGVENQPVIPLSSWVRLEGGQERLEEGDLFFGKISWVGLHRKFKPTRFTFGVIRSSGTNSNRL